MIFWLPAKKVLTIALLLFFSFLMLSTSSLAEPFKVTKVYDGDTIKAEGHGTEIKVRLAGVDAPEISGDVRGLGQPFSRKARDYLAGLIFDKDVEIKGHGYLGVTLLLGEIFFEEKNINLEMVRAGLAEVSEEKISEDLDLEPFFKAEGESKAAKKGVWVQGDKYISPRVWRRKKRTRSAGAMILYGIYEEKVK